MLVDMFQISNLHCSSAVPTASNLLQSPRTIALISGWMLWEVGSGLTTSCPIFYPGFLFIMRMLHPENDIIESLRSTNMLLRCLKALLPMTAANLREMEDCSTEAISYSVCIFLRFEYTCFSLACRD